MIDVKEYAEALFSLAEERKTTDALLADFSDTVAVLDREKDYASLLDTPAVPAEEKFGLIDRAFAAVDPDLRSFLKILSSGHAICDLGKCLSAFRSLYDESRGIERVEAVTAVPMTQSQLAAMKVKLDALTGKTTVIRNTVDPSILGGVKLRYEGIQLDGSVRSRLDSFGEGIRLTVVG